MQTGFLAQVAAVIHTPWAIVEDDAEHLLKDEEILAALGYEPVGCTDAADAHVMLREAPERFEVVIVGHLASATAALDRIPRAIADTMKDYRCTRRHR